MSSTQPSSSPQTHSRPVSSRTSRTTASARISPRSTRPPGHRPLPGGRAVAPTDQQQRAVVHDDRTDGELGRGCSRQVPVHDDGPGREPEASRRSSWSRGRPGSARRRCPTAPRSVRPLDDGVHHGLADPDRPGLGLGEEVVDHDQGGAVGHGGRGGRRRSRPRSRRTVPVSTSASGSSSAAAQALVERRAAADRAGPHLAAAHGGQLARPRRQPGGPGRAGRRDAAGRTPSMAVSPSRPGAGRSGSGWSCGGGACARSGARPRARRR